MVDTAALVITAEDKLPEVETANGDGATVLSGIAVNEDDGIKTSLLSKRLLSRLTIRDGSEDNRR